MTSLPIIDIAPLLDYLPSPHNPEVYEKRSPTSPELTAAVQSVANELYDACTTVGFFYIKSNVYPDLPQLITTIQTSAQAFFKQPLDTKRRVDMTTVGPAWRGYFCVGDELTSSKPDIKEGLYLGSQLDLDDPRTNNIPMHGVNVFPRCGEANPDYNSADRSQHHLSFQFQQTDNDKQLESAILKYLLMVKSIGFAIMDGMSLSLDLPRYYLRNVLLRRDNAAELSEEALAELHEDSFYDPLCLYRIFNYPALQQYQAQYDEKGFVTHDGSETSDTPLQNNQTVFQPPADKKIYSVGEHTDYGSITILYQDDSGGLEVRDLKTGDFIPAPPIPNTFVCNIGDIFEKITHGVFVSTPHRVSNPRNRDRISFPFFFDPAWTAPLTTIIAKSPKLVAIFDAKEKADVANGVTVHRHNDVYKRWDGKEIGLTSFNGQYGDYILGKVSKVFPQLAKAANIQTE